MKYPASQPCPRPGKMKIVRTVEGEFWRTDRGKGDKPAVLNDACERQKNLLSTLSPVAAKFAKELRLQTHGMKLRRFNNRVKSCLQRSIEGTGGLDYRYMRDLVFQPEYPLYRLLNAVPQFVRDEK